MKFSCIQDNITPLRILNFASFFQYQRFVMPISFLFYVHNGLNFSDFILFQSIFNITCLVAKIPMGMLGDMFSKKHILIFSYFLFLLRVVLWINFSGFWIILAGEILYGLFKAFYRGNVDSYIYEYLKSENKETRMLRGYGRLSFYSSMGSAISCFAGVILFKFFGYKSLLTLELIMQIAAVSLLFFLPNIKSVGKRLSFSQCLGSVKKSILKLVKNIHVNYFVYYSAMLTGLTSIFVWNFQPLLKASGAPVFLFGVVNFINQTLRGLGGLTARRIIVKLGEIKLVKYGYVSVITSFLVLLVSIMLKNYIVTLISLLIISLAIFLFVIFNIFTTVKIHEYTYSCRRAVTSSTNTFLGDFSSFFLLLIFKILYDHLGLLNSILLFFVIFIILLSPVLKKKMIDL